MTMGQIIAAARRRQGLTQEALAQQLGVSNQAVSKWESDQCCPDIALLPKLAQVLSLSLDELFGIAPKEPEAEPSVENEAAEEMNVSDEPNEPDEPDDPDEPDEPDKPWLMNIKRGNRAAKESMEDLPWEDDDTMRVVVYIGHRLVVHMNAAPQMTFTYNGRVRDVYSELNLTCGDVEGDAAAGANITCGDVVGHVSAGESVQITGDVEGNVQAGKDAECGDVEGSVTAGMSVTCKDVGGDVTCGKVQGGDVGGSINCGDVEGDAAAGANITCGSVGGDVSAGASAQITGDVDGDVQAGKSVECGNVDGDVSAGMSVTCGDVGGDVSTVIHKQK